MDELLCPCTVVIPLDYNPDRPGESPRPVEHEVKAEILSWFNRQFGGYRIAGMAGVGDVPPGCWEGQFDRSMTVVVALPERRTAQFVEVVRAIGARLGQRAMYYEIGPPTARIMLIEEEGQWVEDGGRDDRGEVASGGL